MNEDLLFQKTYYWISSLFKQKGGSSGRPLYIILNAPQGAGKTTISTKLMESFASDGKRAVSLSIDDFYLTRKEQEALSQKYSHNIFLQERGYPGTHDVVFGESVLSSLLYPNESSDILLPVYDKSAFNGLGDRKPKEKWKKCTLPLDLVLLEGWMIGFPVIINLSQDHFQYETNLFLESYDLWLKNCDGFIHLSPLDLSYIIDWRVEAEENQKKRGLSGMSKEHITQYINKFIPAYEFYLPELKKRLSSFPSHLYFQLNKDRSVFYK